MNKWEYDESRIKDSVYDKYRRFSFKCGFCGEKVSGFVKMIYMVDDGPVARENPERILIKYILCPSCAHGSVWHKDTNDVIPGTYPGKKLDGLPPIVEQVYEEARKCMSVSAYTASELLCRKLIMNIAVEKGAKKNESFQFYINYLEEQKYITPGIKEWADKIRDNGNEATHEIETPERERAYSTFSFTEQLLNIIYVMPKLAEKHQES